MLEVLDSAGPGGCTEGGGGRVVFVGVGVAGAPALGADGAPPVGLIGLPHVFP